VAYTKYDQMSEEAKHAIERASVEIQRRSSRKGLKSAHAKALLEAMPTAEQLMPSVSVEQIQKQLAPAGKGDDEGMD
jgi:hypothetical protein